MIVNPIFCKNSNCVLKATSKGTRRTKIMRNTTANRSQYILNTDSYYTRGILSIIVYKILMPLFLKFNQCYLIISSFVSSNDESIFNSFFMIFNVNPTRLTVLAYYKIVEL
jgi:hypothetical protein